MDAKHGHDGWPGTKSRPFQTITQALASVSSCTKTIQIAEGTYDSNRGERLPLTIPPGLTVLGDLSHHGNVVVRGSGATQFPMGDEVRALAPTIMVGSRTTIAGLRIIPDSDAYPGLSVGILVGFGFSDVSIHDDMITSGAYIGIYIQDATNVRVEDNALMHLSTGAHCGTGAKALFAGNEVRDNFVGIEVADPGCDLGGGPMKSQGDNDIACNQTCGLALLNPLVGTDLVYAERDMWTHWPLETYRGAIGDFDDVCIPAGDGLTPITDHGEVASPCPY